MFFSYIFLRKVLDFSGCGGKIVVIQHKKWRLVQLRGGQKTKSEGKGVVSMLMGTYSHSLDDKGRLIIPKTIREELGEGFVITRNPDHCLSVYPKEAWQQLIASMETLPKISSEPARRIRRFYFGNSSSPEPDKQGRVLIPQDLRNYAGLIKDVTLVGVDDHAEIWDQETWTKYNEEADLSDIAYNIDGINL